MKLFSPAGAATPARRAGTVPASPGRLAVAGTRDYPGGYSDDVIEEFGAEDGAAAVNNPAIWGEANSRPSSIEVINGAHGTALHLIGDGLRADIQSVVCDIEKKVPQHATASADAVRASDENKSARIGQLALRAKLRRLGLATPDPRAALKAAGILLALFVGDWALIAVSFQMLGLSDEPWIPGFAVTDDLHLAALASVITLVVLAHAAGTKLRRLHHDADQRRRAVDPAEREKLPRVSTFDIALASAFLLVALVAVLGVGAVRIDYLLATGAPVSAVPFLLIQAAVLIAAVAIAFEFTHPFAREWKAAQTAVTTTDTNVAKDIAALDLSAGSLNADIELLGSLTARAGHHTGADAANAIRQGRLLVRRATLSQPETTTEQLFPEQLPEPGSPEGEALLAALTGITALPTYVKTTTTAFHTHHAANEAAVRAVAALLERAELGEAFDTDDLAELETEHPVTSLVAVDDDEEAAA